MIFLPHQQDPEMYVCLCVCLYVCMFYYHDMAFWCGYACVLLYAVCVCVCVREGEGEGRGEGLCVNDVWISLTESCCGHKGGTDLCVEPFSSCVPCCNWLICTHYS